MAFMEHSLPENYQLRKFFIDRQKKLRTEQNEQKISIFCSSSHLKSLFLQNVLIICTLRKFSRSKNTFLVQSEKSLHRNVLHACFPQYSEQILPNWRYRKTLFSRLFYVMIVLSTFEEINSWFKMSMFI